MQKFSLEVHLVRRSASQESESHCKMIEVNCPLRSADLLTRLNRVLSSGKTSPDASIPKTTLSDAFLRHLPEKAHRSNQQGENGQTRVTCLDPKEMQRGECLTLNISEWPNAAAVCSLSHVLQTDPIHERYFLSPKACTGILRRAEKRGKKLPESLETALVQVVQDTWWEGIGALRGRSQDSHENIVYESVSKTLKANPCSTHREDSNTYVIKQWPAEIASCLNAHYGDKAGLEDQHINQGTPLFVREQRRVRRLTEIECERLQGFPDNYTNIPYGRPKYPDQICPSGHRYKALGNSMAVPVMRWIGERLLTTT